MNRILKFYRYGDCLSHYERLIMNIRQAKIKGEVILAKPVLLVAVIDSIDKGEIISNKIYLTQKLEGRYLMLMSHYAKESQFEEITPINNPFWHLQSDGFWHLYGQHPDKMTVTATKARLTNESIFAFVDDDLWTLLQNKEMRIMLREYIVEHKLTNGPKSRFNKVAERVGVIAALIATVA